MLGSSHRMMYVLNARGRIKEMELFSGITDRELIIFMAIMIVINFLLSFVAMWIWFPRIKVERKPEN